MMCQDKSSLSRIVWSLVIAVGATISVNWSDFVLGEPPVVTDRAPATATDDEKGDAAPQRQSDKPADKKQSEEKPAEKKPAEQVAAERKAAKKAAEKFLRIVRDAAGDPQSMQTSIVSYKPKGDDRKGLVVDLVGAVHVGDGAYYEKLNKAFKEYDVVLYELVAPEGTKIPKGGRTEGGGHPVGAIQMALKDILDLEFQLEKVDYTPGNFVHADMSPEEFSKTMEARGESFLQMFFKMMGASIAQQAGKKGGSSDAEVLLALFSPDRAFKLKRVMAQQFEDLGGTMSMIEGPKGSTIIGERNRKAFEVLKKEIGAGKKKIAVFYGAGHLPDMEKRLAADFELHPGDDVKWIEAWDLRQKKSR